MENKELFFLVEDNAIYAANVKRRVEQEMGHEVMVFETGEKMLAYAESNAGKNPTIIILDYNLNSIDSNAKNGAEILAMLRNPSKQLQFFKKTPVIILSSETEIAVVLGLLKKGANDYIVKDDTFFDNLKKTVNTIIDIRNYRNEIQFHKSKAESFRKRLIYMALAIIALLGITLFAMFG
jgi:DNA-binding NarL/FixJ family response regulator